MIKIIKMDKNEYFNKYGDKYLNGELWDYPITELEYLCNECYNSIYALIDNRLYEIK